MNHFEAKINNKLSKFLLSVNVSIARLCTDYIRIGMLSQCQLYNKV